MSRRLHRPVHWDNLAHLPRMDRSEVILFSSFLVEQLVSMNFAREKMSYLAQVSVHFRLPEISVSELPCI
jgi:hypothetical protein